MIRILPACALLLLLMSGCAINPVSGRPQAVLTTEAGEIERDAEAAAAVEAQMGLIESPELAAYVDEIGQRLVRQSPRRDIAHHFHVVEMVEPNAFALPGGHVYVSRGLLALLNSEDELANVIGHEIGHVAARHSAQQQVRSAVFLPAKIVGGLGGLATSIVSPRLGRVVSGLAQLPGTIALASYSRGQEREADRLGQTLAAASGWDPAAMSSFMHTLAREEKLAGGDPDRMSFFASHPRSPERSAESLSFAQGLTRASAEPVARGREAFLRRLEGIVVGERAAEGVFVENTFLQPSLELALTFPREWETRNTQSAVIARSSDKKRFVVLTLAGKGDDPLEAARAFASKARLRDEPRTLRIGALPAAHAVGESGSGRDRMLLHLTWIAHRGVVYQISGISPPGRFEADLPAFDATSRSFHALTAGERDRIRESRLRFTQARAGETLSALLERAGSSWKPDEAAVANALEANAELSAGAWVKLARPEPYAGD